MTLKGIAALSIALCLVACGSSNTTDSSGNNSTSVTTAATAPVTFNAALGGSCQYGYEDPCFYNATTNTTTRFVNQADIVTIKNNPAAIATIYPEYSAALQSKLGSSFTGINDNGLALIFAALVAYE